MPRDLVEQVAWLRERTELPICIGFGISKMEHVQTLAPVADGLIVGSAIVRRFADNPDTNGALEEVRALSQSLIAAMDA